MNRYSIPIFRPKGEGFTVRWKCANSQPETLAKSAAIRKMPILWRSVSTPMASAIKTLARMARMARPVRESSRFNRANTPSSTSPQASTKKLRPWLISQLPSMMGGTPWMPSYLPSASRLPIR